MNKRILLVLMLVVGLMTGPAFAQSDFGEYGTILPVKGQSSLVLMRLFTIPAHWDLFRAENTRCPTRAGWSIRDCIRGHWLINGAAIRLAFQL